MSTIIILISPFIILVFERLIRRRERAGVAHGGGEVGGVLVR
jgi:hypothetical protein